MHLTLHNVVHYLLSRGLVTTADVVHSGCEISNSSSRNRCYRVAFRNGTGVFVKQALQSDPIMRRSVEVESAFSQFFSGQSANGRMVSLVPKWISFDAERSILCTQLILAESFRSVSLQDSQRVELAKLLGAGLASIHSVNSNELADLPTATRHRVPTILQLAKYGVGDDPAKIWQTLSAYPDFVKLISEQIQHWTPTGLTHGDMRWDNLLVTKTDDSLKLSIVDWELAGVGDCAWDVGGVLQSYLIDWSVDLIDSDQLQQLTIAFWQAYVVEARLSATGANRLLERTIMFAACRLIQSTFEHHQFGNELESTGRRLLQLSWNILKEPQEVLRSLLPLQAVEL